jgi:hypothetical protein
MEYQIEDGERSGPHGVTSKKTAFFITPPREPQILYRIKWLVSVTEK